MHPTCDVVPLVIRGRLRRHEWEVALVDFEESALAHVCEVVEGNTLDVGLLQAVARAL